MKKIKCYVSTGMCGSEVEDIIEVNDNATQNEIKEAANDWLFNTIDWGYWEAEEKED